MKKFLTLALALCMCLSLGISAFAAESEIDTDGGAGSTPVYLTSTEDGSFDGTPSGTAMSVTVPTALPMAMAQNGDVTTADNCRIVNHSYGAVRVKSVTIASEGGWAITSFGDKASLAAEKVDANKFGFSIRIGGGAAAGTDSSDADSQTLIASPIAGCYMTGAGDSANNSVSVEYAAIVTPISAPVINANIASVVFVVEWDAAA